MVASGRAGGVSHSLPSPQWWSEHHQLNIEGTMPANEVKLRDCLKE